jgi:hypothetical protein
MTLDEFVSQGWADHANDASGVFGRCGDAASLVTDAAHLPALAALIVHVSGEHLGRWADGVAHLERLEALPVFDATSPQGKAVLRSKAVLHRCAGNAEEEARCFAASVTGGDVPEASDRVRLLAVAASALVGQKQLDRARADFEEAVALAGYGPAKEDPAARALAVTAHNLAVEFENRGELTDDERAMMLRCAFVSRDFWRIAGGWLEAERAEYRLAMSHVKAGDAKSALSHAKECLAIVGANGADAFESFFAREAVARAQLAAGYAGAARRERDDMAALLPAIADEDARKMAETELAKLDASIPAPRERAHRPPKAGVLKSPWK